MATAEIKVFEGRWGTQTYVYALSAIAAENKVRAHFAFGDPNEDYYAIGNHWATNVEGDGWQVVECKVAAKEITGQKRGSNYQSETVHINWKCPECMQHFSEDYREDDEMPLLAKCGCKGKDKYFLIRF